MGKRNLSAVGTHEDYCADMLDELTGADPSVVTGCASPADAATSYFRNVFEKSGGRVETATVAVWLVDGLPQSGSVFDVEAMLTPCDAPDAQPGEHDVRLVAKERR